MFATSIGVLTGFFINLDAESFARWVLGVVVFGGLAFGAGYAYGKFFRKADGGSKISSLEGSYTHADDTIQKLERLTELRDKGSLSQEEFDELKRKILGK